MNQKIIRIAGWMLAAALLLSGGALTASAAPRGGRIAPQPPVREVYLGGMPFGVKFFTDGVLVVGFCDVSRGTSSKEVARPAQDAGIQIKDVITAVGGAELQSAEDLTAAIEASEGKTLTLTVRRKERGGVKELQVSLAPVFSAEENRYKAGLWVRDSGAGIGTVTYIDPESYAFGGLGHGICDGETGEVIPMRRGQVCDVIISGIEKGKSGAPGAIKGYFAPGKTGSLVSNTDRGVFGAFATCPPAASKRLLIAKKEDVKEGKATLRCTLENGQMAEYTVQIGHIDRHARGSRCFTVTVTDPVLIEKTGGIVQGMSGSPIIQNGKLIGAVTHVMVNDPTQGYGIFIENMLNAAQMPMAKAS